MVLYLIAPLAAAAGRCAVVPIGIEKKLLEVVFAPYTLTFAIAAFAVFAVLNAAFIRSVIF